VSGIIITVRAQLADGKGAEFTALSAEVSARVERDEPGTLAYQWYLSEDGAHYLVYERYEDSEAFLRHVENVAPFMERFLSLGAVESIAVLGVPSPEAKAVFDEWQAVVYTGAAGFIRR